MKMDMKENVCKTPEKMVVISSIFFHHIQIGPALLPISLLCQFEYDEEKNFIIKPTRRIVMRISSQFTFIRSRIKSGGSSLDAILFLVDI